MGRAVAKKMIRPVLSGLIALVLIWCYYTYGNLRNIHKTVHLMEPKSNIFNFQSEEISRPEIDAYLSEHNERLTFYKRYKEYYYSHSLPTIFFITPTYARLQQKADLTRLSQTLQHIRNLHWIVVEDSRKKTSLVANLLVKCGITFTHLHVRTPSAFQLRPGDPHTLMPRGAVQRNAGLTWIRTTVDPGNVTGVVYFADDDNTYSVELFDEIRKTMKVSVWPVGLAGKLRYERPIVKGNKVVGWHNYWKLTRKFPVDMASFAVNLKVIFNHPDAIFKNTNESGMLETQILEDLGVTLDDLEPRADNCTKVLVWHTRTQTPSIRNEYYMLQDYGRQSDRNIEV